MGEQHIFHFRSEDFKNTYPNNHGFDFTVDLKTTYRLDGTWYLIVLDAAVPRISGSHFQYLMCDLCVDSHVRDQMLPVALPVNKIPKKNYVGVYPINNTGLPVKIKKNSFNQIRFYILDGNLKFSPVSKHQSFVTVLLRKDV